MGGLTESIIETKTEKVKEKINYKELNLSTEVIKQVEKALCDGSECSVVCLESRRDRNQEVERENVIIGSEESLNGHMSHLQVSSCTAVYFTNRYKCSFIFTVQDLPKIFTNVTSPEYILLY